MYFLNSDSSPETWCTNFHSRVLSKEKIINTVNKPEACPAEKAVLWVHEVFPLTKSGKCKKINWSHTRWELS